MVLSLRPIFGYQLYVRPPVACSCKLSPMQTAVSVPAFGTGRAITVILTLSKFSQPAWFSVRRYTMVLTGGLAKGVCVRLLLIVKLLYHLYLYALAQFNCTLSPRHKVSSGIKIFASGRSMATSE